MPLYKITFTDNSTFLGGETLENSKWNEIPDKDIYRLEYFLSDNTSLVLQNFEAYAAFTEATKNPISNIGNCPICKGKAKLSKMKYRVGDRSYSRIVARCRNSKCKWIGEVKELQNKAESKAKAEYKYVMGLKNGIVTSYRIALEGKKGTDKYEKGDVTKRNYVKGKEHRGNPVADWVWKKGIK